MCGLLLRKFAQWHPTNRKVFGFPTFGWLDLGYQSLSMLTQLLQMDPRADSGKFTPKRMPRGFVPHVQDYVNGTP